MFNFNIRERIIWIILIFGFFLVISTEILGYFNLLERKIIISTLEDKKKYIPPADKALKLVLEDDRPLKIINAPKNISAAIMRLQAFEDRFLYIVKYLDIKTTSFEEVAGKGSSQLTFNQILLEVAAPYAAEDADITLRLHQNIHPLLENQIGPSRVFRSQTGLSYHRG